jgi:perosamine synthetase
MHKQPVFQRLGLFQGERYPVAERLGSHGFYVPSGVALEEAQIETVARKVRELIA